MKLGAYRCAALILSASLMMQAAAARAAEVFNVTSPVFKDNDAWPSKYAGVDPKRTPPCGGENVSPPIAWSNAPANTKSFVVMMYDVDAGNGLANTHWVAYGLPVTKTSLAEGEGSTPPKDFVAGKNGYGDDHYFGACPPAGNAAHHYLITVIATDLTPDALKPGLTRDEVIASLRGGHALRGATIVGRYARPD
jgi:Raf kinase inhibitor-like YbhB/YbcL family protein